MRNYGRILVGLDGLDPDEQAIRYAAMVARLTSPLRQTPARQVRHASLARRGEYASSTRTCVPPGRGRHEDDSGQEIRFVALLQQLGQVEPSPRALLAAAVKENFVGEVRAPISFDLLKGRPLERLPALAADFDADLLVLDEDAGPRRKCARAVVEAQCPAWLVPRNHAPVLRRILVPVDFSARSAACVRTAVDLARRFPPAKCALLHVVPHHFRLGSNELTSRQKHDLAVEFDEFMAPIDMGDVGVEPLFLKGARVAGAIQHACRNLSADLTIMSARRRARLASSVLPSQAELAIRACPGAFLVLKSGNRPLGLAEAIQERWQNADSAQFA